MRTLVDIPEQQLLDLGKICALKEVSRAEVVRQALAAYIVANQPEPPVEAFGLWKHQVVDGMAYQEQVRSEW